MRRSTPNYLYFAVFMPVASLDALLTDKDVEGEPFDIMDEAPTAEERLANDQTFHMLDRFLGSLSPRERMIVEGVHWHGRSQVDVARQFGVSKMAICKTLARIYERARKMLGNEEYLSFAN